MKKYKTKITEEWRVCTKCLEFKTRDNYSYWWKSRTGRQSRCKECYKLYINAPLNSKIDYINKKIYLNNNKTDAKET